FVRLGKLAGSVGDTFLQFDIERLQLRLRRLRAVNIAYHGVVEPEENAHHDNGSGNEKQKGAVAEGALAFQRLTQAFSQVNLQFANAPPQLVHVFLPFAGLELIKGRGKALLLLCLQDPLRLLEDLIRIPDDALGTRQELPHVFGQYARIVDFGG